MYYNVSNIIYLKFRTFQSSTYGWELGPTEFLETNVTAVFSDPEHLDFRLVDTCIGLNHGLDIRFLLSDLGFAQFCPTFYGHIGQNLFPE